MLSLPNTSSVRSTRFWSCSSLPTLHATAMARRPVVSISSATCCASSCFISAMTTSAPACASIRALARPMPLPPPVTTATLPVKSNRGAMFMMILRLNDCVTGSRAKINPSLSRAVLFFNERQDRHHRTPQFVLHATLRRLSGLRSSRTSGCIARRICRCRICFLSYSVFSHGG